MPIFSDIVYLILVVFYLGSPLSVKNVHGGSIISELKHNQELSSSDDVTQRISELMKQVVQQTNNVTENTYSDNYCSKENTFGSSCNAPLNSNTNNERFLEKIEEWFSKMKKYEITQLDPEYENMSKAYVKPNSENTFFLMSIFSTIASMVRSESASSFKEST